MECGYVSRLRELSLSRPVHHEPENKTTIAIPWIGENTRTFLDHLLAALERIKLRKHKWRIFLEKAGNDQGYLNRFSRLPNCHISGTGPEYIDSLICSQSAIIYGGYNSIVDVLSLCLPSLIIQRQMNDNEQQEHLNHLMKKACGSLFTLPEDCNENQLVKILEKLTEQDNKITLDINLDGAEKAACYIATLLD